MTDNNDEDLIRGIKGLTKNILYLALANIFLIGLAININDITMLCLCIAMNIIIAAISIDLLRHIKLNSD